MAQVPAVEPARWIQSAAPALRPVPQRPTRRYRFHDARAPATLRYPIELCQHSTPLPTHHWSK